MLKRFLIFRLGDLGSLVSGHRFQRTSRPSGGLSHALPLRGLVAQVMYGLAIEHGLGITVMSAISAVALIASAQP